jgi:hypothetical protein
MLYARVPAQWETPDEWSRVIRSTIVHETKHLASYAQRLANRHEFEEPWLEEATARIAEELYARSFSGSTWRGQATFATTVHCEVSQCDDRPLAMWKHFSGLHAYLRGADTLSPIASAGGSDFSHYASGWSLVRWVLDYHAGTESDLLRALVRGGNGTGLTAISRLAGISARTILGHWGASHYAPPAVGQGTRSWNESAIFLGLNTLFPEFFSAAPARAHSLRAGNFSMRREGMRVGSIVNVSLTVRSEDVQLLQLTGGGEFALAVTRWR